MASIIRRSLFGDIDLEKSAIDLLREYEPSEGYYLANSGGKDSGVLRHIVIKSGVKFDAHYNWTTVDPPELLYHIRLNNPETLIHKPKLSMWELMVKKRMPPTRIFRFCCSVLKEGGGKNRIVLTGVRSAESFRRSQRKQVEGNFNKSTKRFVHPLFYWSDLDIWNYTRSNNIPYCSLYDEGFKRLGCIGCPMQGRSGMERDFERWPKHKAAYLRTFERIIKNGFPSSPSIHHSSAEALFAWWVSGKSSKPSPNLNLFEPVERIDNSNWLQGVLP